MFNLIFMTGLIGSVILVTGAAWPEGTTKDVPIKSAKEWLFAIGALIMLIYAILNWMQGGPIFFMILEILIVISCILMMLNTNDKIDTAVLSVSGVGLVIWSLFLFEGYDTIVFILGLCGIGLGYAFSMGTLRRELALTFGSALIAAFSYLTATWIFFWLNLFFALFSAYYLIKVLKPKSINL